MADISATALKAAICAGDIFVAHCPANEIWIVCRRSKPAERLLREHGYVFRAPADDQQPEHVVQGRYWVRPVSDAADKGAQLMWLRDQGIPFSGGKEWNTQEVFQHLRDKGLATRGYWAIGWSGPEKFDVRWME